MNSTNETALDGSVDFTLRVMRLTLYPAVLALGIVGNILVSCVIIQFRRRRPSDARPSARYFILNLAVSDLVILIVFIPFDLAYLEYKVWTFGLVMCKLVNTITYAFVTLSGTTLAAISIDRYRAIVYPMKQPFSTRAVLVVIILIWIYAILTLAPFVGSLRVFPNGLCLNDPGWWTSQYAFQMAFLFSGFIPGCIVPICCITVCYILIAIHLFTDHRSNLRSGVIISKIATRRTRQNWKTIKVVTSLVVIYTVCVVPHYIVLTMSIFDLKSTEKLPYIIETYEFTRLLMTANSCMNPLMYSAVSKEFRDKLKGLWVCRQSRIGINPVVFSPYRARRMAMLSPARLRIP